jgi:hypothetical protein
MSLPHDQSEIPIPWGGIFKRLASIARLKTRNHAAVITVKILVDRNAKPIAWTCPDVTTLEPVSASDRIADLLS